MVKALIFDLWGTIAEHGVHPSPSRQVKYMLRAEYTFSDFIAAFEASFMTKKHESLKEGFVQVVKDFNLKIPDFVYEKLIGMWNKNVILAKLYPDVEEVFKKLKDDGYKLILLINIDPFSYEQIKLKFNLDNLFDRIYPSFETGLLKADKAAFQQILDEFNLKAKDVIMIGDSVDSDIKTAENAGIKGILLDRRETRAEYEGQKIKTLEELPVLLK
jgi:HAD superfamily hydrolase (TIGR01549 family)